jgi:hypothetical protein
MKTNIQDYHKRNRHFQCCIETKLLMIQPKYLHVFVVHVFKFIGRSYKCSMCEPFVTRQISIQQSTTLKITFNVIKTVSVVDYRIDICGVTKGSHTQHL